LDATISIMGSYFFPKAPAQVVGGRFQDDLRAAAAGNVFSRAYGTQETRPGQSQHFMLG
jgi:hypothetical protein